MQIRRSGPVWALLTALAGCGGASDAKPSGRDGAIAQAHDGTADAGPARADVGALGPQCSAVVACCPLHLDMFADLAECESYAARQGEDLCMDRRRMGWCGVDGGSQPDA